MLQALQDLCEACADHLAQPQQLNGLMQIYGNMNSLDIKEQEKIIEGLGVVLVRSPTDQLPNMIAAVSTPPKSCGLIATNALTPRMPPKQQQHSRKDAS